MSLTKTLADQSQEVFDPCSTQAEMTAMKPGYIDHIRTDAGAAERTPE